MIPRDVIRRYHDAREKVVEAAKAIEDIVATGLCGQETACPRCRAEAAHFTQYLMNVGTMPDSSLPDYVEKLAKLREFNTPPPDWENPDPDSGA